VPSGILQPEPVTVMVVPAGPVDGELEALPEMIRNHALAA